MGRRARGNGQAGTTPLTRVKPRDLVAYEKMEDLLRALKASEVGAAVLALGPAVEAVRSAGVAEIDRVRACRCRRRRCDG